MFWHVCQFHQKQLFYTILSFTFELGFKKCARGARLGPRRRSQRLRVPEARFFPLSARKAHFWGFFLRSEARALCILGVFLHESVGQ
ncbi:hypothetical protein HanIR_Chr03g0114901 [Helianthus annuus]|nr:hypothetical protein HanIR_Chr03g0114901 [Helianthus annuus]